MDGFGPRVGPGFRAERPDPGGFRSGTGCPFGERRERAGAEPPRCQCGKPDESRTDARPCDERSHRGSRAFDGWLDLCRSAPRSRIDELKEQIRRSHTRLSLLTDSILSSGISGSRAEIEFQNEMGGAYRLTKAVFILDGAVQYNQSDDSGLLGEQRTIPIFSGSIPPGDHTIQVHLQLKGHGYGVFSYMRGYQFEVKSSHSFTAIEGKTTNLQILAYERGGSTAAHEERPAVRYIEKVTSGVAPSAASGGSATRVSVEAKGR